MNIIVGSGIQGFKSEISDRKSSSDLESELISEFVCDGLRRCVSLDYELGRLLIVISKWNIWKFRLFVGFKHVSSRARSS